MLLPCNYEYQQNGLQYLLACQLRKLGVCVCVLCLQSLCWKLLHIYDNTIEANFIQSL